MTDTRVPSMLHTVVCDVCRKEHQGCREATEAIPPHRRTAIKDFSVTDAADGKTPASET